MQKYEISQFLKGNGATIHTRAELTDELRSDIRAIPGVEMFDEDTAHRYKADIYYSHLFDFGEEIEPRLNTFLDRHNAE